MVGRRHRRLRRGAGRGRAADHPVLEVRTIDQRVLQVRGSLEAAAANTEDTALIAVAAEGVESVLAEGLEHHLFLGRVLGKVRS